MSNALVIAHVSQALALLIESHLRPEIDMAVKVEPRKPPAEAPADPTISVFLYQVTPNPSMRHNDLPTRASNGTLLRRAAAALDLHYVISAYGDETELVGQRLIGSVVRTLHETPVLPKDVIDVAGERPYLAGSNLAEAAQQVRFTPMVMDIDETSKLWGMLYQTPYSLSVVYQASLVLVDGRETPVPARPVERSGVRVLPFGAPGAPVPPSAGPEAPDAPSKGQAGEPERGGAGGRGRHAETAAAEAESGGPHGEKTAKAPAKAPAKAVARTAKAAGRNAAKTAAKAPAHRRGSASKAATSTRDGAESRDTTGSHGAGGRRADGGDTDGRDGREDAES